MKCQHQFVIAYVPAPVGVVAKLLKAAHCPMCGAGPKQIAPAHTGEDASAIASRSATLRAIVSDTASIYAWLANGERGMSSEAMACTALGTRARYGPRHPIDPADLRRCMLLVDQAPEVREAFPAIAALSPTWAKLIEHWDELIAMLREEMAAGNMAPRTYARMQELGA